MGRRRQARRPGPFCKDRPAGALGALPCREL